MDKDRGHDRGAHPDQDLPAAPKPDQDLPERESIEIPNPILVGQPDPGAEPNDPDKPGTGLKHPNYPHWPEKTLPDNELPQPPGEWQGRPDQGLPGGIGGPPSPDQGLPGTGARPDNELPETAEPK